MINIKILNKKNMEKRKLNKLKRFWWKYLFYCKRYSKWLSL